MSVFRRKKPEKESNIAMSPVRMQTKKGVTKKQFFLLIFNIVSILLYSCYTLFVTYKMTDERSFLGRFIFVMLIAYAIAFILLILVSLKSRKKLKSRLKNYKSATKFLNYVTRIINFVLSISTLISALVNTGRTDIPAIGYAILSLIITIILIILEIAAIIVRKNIPLIKRNFLEIRDPEKYNEKIEVNEDD